MSKTIFTPSISTRPTYADLVSRGSAPALILAEGLGAEAILALTASDASVMDQAHLIFIPNETEFGPRLSALRPKQYHVGPSYPAILTRFKKALLDARMGTQLYLAGSEELIGLATAEALSAGLPLDAIQAEHRGAITRRMQCVHCKGVTLGVSTDPFKCSHCGLTLFVRDHFSRRLGAFQGVCVDAEEPGCVPPERGISA
ncbi:dimethylamine monooxygenase subunit DmmA family protein [Albirhodobacter sp. R86504]|uniref:dimethylamine monooxygenase subunit DmmA family protein n=1 Tax=Albirhodobacter sp. R86504 TaxID=3093848 RepID=UPI00366CAA33